MPLAPLFPVVHPILKSAFPRCLWTGDLNSREIALTIDDGPHRQHTPQLLKVLDKYDIKASFFWLGFCVDRHPETAKEVCDRGHWIGLPRLPAYIVSQTQNPRTQTKFRRHAKSNCPSLRFRPKINPGRAAAQRHFYATNIRVIATVGISPYNVECRPGRLGATGG